jgi:methylmalonyl-CoA carboxyltransferase 5S subunit
MTGEFADLMLGYYGETLGRRDRHVIEMANKQTGKPVIDIRPADLLKPEWQSLRSAAIALDGCNGSDEDVLTYAMFPQVAPKFFPTRAQGPKNLGKDPKAEAAPAPASGQPGAAPGGKGQITGPVTYDVKLNGRTHKVTVSPA